MEVRDATPSDADRIRDVHYRSIRGLARETCDREQVDAWAGACESADYTAPVEDDDVEYVVAEKNGEIVAFGSLELGTPDEYAADVDAEVTAVYVHPDVSRQGVGSAIYAELEERARARDVRTLGLSASVNAVPFYERQGYERVREFEYAFGGDVTGPAVEMKKVL